MNNNEFDNKNGGEAENQTQNETQNQTGEQQNKGYYVDPPKKQTSALMILGIVLLILVGIPFILFGICILILVNL